MGREGYADRNVILIGPEFALHNGIHGSLMDFPPSGIRYNSPPYIHRFLPASLPSGQHFDPFSHFSICEITHYPHFEEPEVLGVHSSRFPVGGTFPWLADADCLLATLTSGDAYAVGQASADGVVTVSDKLAIDRVTRMIAHYIDDRCQGILFHSEFGRKNLMSFLHDTGVLKDNELHLFARKLHVLYPTLPAVKPVDLPKIPINVLYSGRTYEDKGGDITAEVFDALWDRYSDKVRLNWIGKHPASLREKMPFVEFHSTLHRGQYLRLLEKSHILFSPTLFESYGMAIVEAACLGLGIVTSCGNGMEPISELFSDGVHAHLVDNRFNREEKIREYVSKLSSLIDNPINLQEMRHNNYRLASAGKLSLERRNSSLRGYYDRFAKWTNENAKFSSSDRYVNLAGYCDFDSSVLRGEYLARFPQPRRILVNVTGL